MEVTLCSSTVRGSTVVFWPYKLHCPNFKMYEMHISVFAPIRALHTDRNTEGKVKTLNKK